jgi:beta-glucanase (GH16 family)
VCLRLTRRVTVLAASLVFAASIVVAVVMVSAAKSSTTVPAAGSTGSTGSSAEPWALAWAADFAGPADSAPSGWKFEVGQGIFGDGDVADLTRSPANVRLNGHGDLDLTAVGRGPSWTSARIESDASFGAPAGGELMVTASIEQPDPASGLGYWPAFWMLGPGQWPATGEIDIMEDVNAASDHSAAFHCGNLTQRNPDGTTGPCHEYTGLSSGLLPCSGCQAGYHVYTAIIDRRDAADEQIRWYLDGQLFFTVSESQVGTQAWTAAVDHGFSIILDLAVGGKYPDGRCQCTTPTLQTTSGATMSVQYVKVYSSAPSGS